MSKIILSISVLFLLGCSNYPTKKVVGPSTSPIEKAISYNIRYDNPKDGIDKWDNRKEAVGNMLAYYEPEIFGLQECLAHQLRYLDQQLINYSRIGVGRDDGKQKGEFSPIYYDHTKLTLLQESTFWLSEQPEQVSVGWDASMERICTYGVFENKISKKKILVLNAHYDHIGPIAREQSSQLILAKIQAINSANYPILLMGDFNAEPETTTIQLLKKELRDGGALAHNGIYGPTGTYTGFKKNAIPTRRIDYIFLKDLEVASYRHIEDKRKGNNYLSDHLPVLVELK